MASNKPINRQNYKVEAQALLNAIHRCHNINHQSYRDYGQRGIMVSSELRGPDGLRLLIEAIGPRPSSDHSLDRIDNNGDYDIGDALKGRPCNLKWSSKLQQQNNRRPHKTHCGDYGWGVGYTKPKTTGKGHGPKASPLLPFQGKTRTMAEWCEILGIKSATVRQRLHKGMTPAQALTKSTSRAGEVRTAVQWDAIVSRQLAAEAALDQAIKVLDKAVAMLRSQAANADD